MVWFVAIVIIYCRSSHRPLALVVLHQDGDHGDAVLAGAGGDGDGGEHLNFMWVTVCGG